MSASRKYGVNEPNVRLWRQQQAPVFACGPARKAFRGPKSGVYPKVEAALVDSSTELVVIPGGMTSQLQPLDVCLNKPFKDRVRHFYNEWMAEETHSFTPAGPLRRPAISLVCQWAADAWYDLPESVVAASFKKCCITNAMDGMENSLVFEESSDKEPESSSDSDSDTENK